MPPKVVEKFPGHLDRQRPERRQRHHLQHAFGTWVTQGINFTSNTIYIYATGNPGGDLDNVVFGASNEVPEPASMALMLLGAAGLAGVRRKARK